MSTRTDPCRLQHLQEPRALQSIASLRTYKRGGLPDVPCSRRPALLEGGPGPRDLVWENARGAPANKKKDMQSKGSNTKPELQFMKTSITTAW